MPAFVAMLLGGLVQIAGSLAGRVMIALGFGIVQYSGVSVTLTWLRDQALSALTGMPGQLVQLLAFMKVGEAISIIFSALGVRLLLNGLSAGGSISRLVRTGG